MKAPIQSIEERLLEVDKVICTTSQTGGELIRLGAPVSEIDGITEFLRHLFQRRDTILWELKKAGVTERQAYAHLRERKEETSRIG